MKIEGKGPIEEVNHPLHYGGHPVCECIDIIEHFNLNLGNAIKYVWRAGLKDEKTKIQDLEKAKWYLEREITRIKEFEEHNIDKKHQETTTI